MFPATVIKTADHPEQILLQLLLIHKGEQTGGSTQSNRKHRTGSSTGGDTDKTGICQRVAEDALHYSAGNTQRRTYKHTYKHTRQADIPDNGKLLPAVISLGKARQIQLSADNRQRFSHRHIYLAEGQRYTGNNN